MQKITGIGETLWLIAVLQLEDPSNQVTSAKSFTIACFFLIFLYSVFGETEKSFFIEIFDLIFAVCVTRISPILLDKPT